MEPEIRFCTSADGVRIAYATLGSGWVPLVCCGGWGSAFETNWSHAESRAVLQQLSRDRLLVMYDRRGVGASQREVDELPLDLETEIGDLSAVVDNLRLMEFDLFGERLGAPAAVAYAATYPDRVRKLVLWGLVASGRDSRFKEDIQVTVARILRDWSVARRVAAQHLFPSGPLELQRWHSDVMREIMSAEVAAQCVTYQSALDISHLLPSTRAPTLVFHRSGDRNAPLAAGRSAAAAIPDARFIALDGDICPPFFGDTSYLSVMLDFLDDGQRPTGTIRVSTTATSALRTVLFTDLVGHTEMMSRLGDEPGREVLRDHERITRNVLKQHGGTEVKTMGDGFMASFGSVTKAVECAIALQRAFAEHEGEPLTVRVGLNAGEPIEEDGDLFGATVILASRIAAKAEGGEILVADTVRGLCSGKGFLFADRGEFVAKGFEEPVRVYEVRWQKDLQQFELKPA